MVEVASSLMTDMPLFRPLSVRYLRWCHWKRSVPSHDKRLQKPGKAQNSDVLTVQSNRMPRVRLQTKNGHPCAQKAFPLPLYPCPEIKTILGRTLVFHFTFRLCKGLLCRGLPPIRASAFDILKLAGSSSHLPGPFPRRCFPRTIFFERCFNGSFV